MRRLGLFGSVARGVSGPDSDLDFVVEFDAKSFDRYMDLKLLLERLFGCTVDLVLSDAIKPRLKHVILGEAVYAQGLRVYLEDILESIQRIRSYTGHLEGSLPS